MMFNWLKKVWNCLFGDNTPTNLREALIALDKKLSKEDKIIMQLRTEQEVLTCTHHTLGRQLRNDWGLWETKKSQLYYWFKLWGVWHADDMSSVIITSYCRRIKGQPIRLKEQVRKHSEYWAAQKYYDTVVGHVFPEEED